MYYGREGYLCQPLFQIIRLIGFSEAFLADHSCLPVGRGFHPSFSEVLQSDKFKNPLAKKPVSTIE